MLRTRTRMASALVAVASLALLITPVSTAAAATTATALSIDAGGTHTCAITPKKGLKCWGYNARGQLGIGDSTSSQPLPLVVPGLINVQSVSTSGENTCAIVGRRDRLMCWGANTYGQVGDGTFDDARVPTVVIGSGVKQVDVGEQHSCAVLETGRAKCWGLNSSGQVGDGTTDQHPLPTRVSRLRSVKSISVGASYACATTTKGAAKCWGQNDYGMLGDGTLKTRYQPVQVTGLTSGVRRVIAAWYSTCAIVTDGRLKCWGNNDNGQLGLGTAGDGNRKSPHTVTGMTSGVTSVDLGKLYACAVKNNVAKCWGWNLYDQLGVGDEADRWVPTNVASLTNNVASVNVGLSHSCALLTTGVAKCWGENGAGQLGINDLVTLQYSTPQKVLL